MPPLEYADHYHDVVYWPVSGTDQYGKPMITDAVGIEGRWESVQREIVAPDGSKTVAEVVLHVSCNVPLKSIVWKGHISELPDPVTDVDNLYEVIFVEETPSLKNKYTNRAVMLRRFRDSLPTMV